LNPYSVYVTNVCMNDSCYKLTDSTLLCGQYRLYKLSPRERRDDMLYADGSSTRGGSTSVRGQVHSPHMAMLQAASVPYSLRQLRARPQRQTHHCCCRSTGQTDALQTDGQTDGHWTVLIRSQRTMWIVLPPQPSFSSSGLTPRILRTVYRYF